jgi:hypothetical protein
MAAEAAPSLFPEPPPPGKRRATAYAGRNAPLFLRNQFPRHGKYGIPLVRKQRIDLTDLELIACTNTVCGDNECFDCGVHFFVDDEHFTDLYAQPEKTLARYSQYRLCCTPDYSVYGEMQTWRQIESVAHGRWVGAWWQSKRMSVVPAVSRDKYASFDFCFDGIEKGCIVAVATYACRQARLGYLRGYSAMLERMHPSAVICHGTPFPGMAGPIVAIQPRHPRTFHRDL